MCVREREREKEKKREKEEGWTHMETVKVLTFTIIWIIVHVIVKQGPTVLAIGAGVVLTFFLLSVVSLFYLPLSGRLKYCLKGPLSPKQMIKRAALWAPL